VTGFTGSPTRAGAEIRIDGVNLMLPATVAFSGGVSAPVVPASASFVDDMSPATASTVTVPAGAKERADHRRHARGQGDERPEPHVRAVTLPGVGPVS
jgi:hypothetical protein